MNATTIISQNKDYRGWIKELKQRYLSARLKATVEVNRTLLEYYWTLGRDIANRQARLAVVSALDFSYL